MSSSEYSCTSFSRLSFDATELPETSQSPENLTLKPHRSSDSSWQAIRSAIYNRKVNGLSFRDFRLMRQIGSGDIGRVYLCSLRGDDDSSFYAMKVVDRQVLAAKKKLQRAEMERKILKMLDHPFLPTLYAEFEASHFSCVVMEYCSGGDLHSLRHRQIQKRFPLNSARFYATEVLVALEYLHMLGIIYRDLKPENVLVRSDGHIMLSDFDLSLCSNTIAAVESPELSPDPPTPADARSPRTTTPFFCISNRLFRSKKIQTLTRNRLFVAEPVTARSCSFVGTHEYVSPEVAGGKSHGNAVDWWAFGIFIYEMIYGRTPFAGDSNEATLRNIVKMPLKFPTSMAASASETQARDLISGLLLKDPEIRLGSRRGAAEVKTHPFFKGLNFALVRTLKPPDIPMTNARFPAKNAMMFDCF
ncbi:protein kinase PINOID-like isoform X1 [Impatiens glandulifera]|uniref:protein kinase PINOID-like isoform X1 n=2 Tax=Impatiens glandulifera TaxID=253017 RepID=UPI001FB05F88|nr:protein kinase PINOID-like isoform X1 [Impatiens glandulifera]XP_047308249.1 protein kinase PINOID-like isoform X1 [Impatiens glandulifera]